MGQLRAGRWRICRRRHRCAGPRVCRSAGCLCAAARHLRAAGDIWTAPRILRLSLWIRRIWRVLRPGLLRRGLLRPRLLWTWLLRASRVAPLERTSDPFSYNAEGSNARTGRSSRTLFARPSLHASPISQSTPRGRWRQPQPVIPCDGPTMIDRDKAEPYDAREASTSILINAQDASTAVPSWRFWTLGSWVARCRLQL